MKTYPPKKRSVAVGDSFPGRGRSIDTVKGPHPKGPSGRPAVSMGKAPKKGVLRTGGGHG